MFFDSDHHKCEYKPMFKSHSKPDCPKSDSVTLKMLNVGPTD